MINIKHKTKKQLNTLLNNYSDGHRNLAKPDKANLIGQAKTKKQKNK
ncbi:MAG: hypothetical protein ABH808_00925 [Candidatus Kuenenbacteria bacterium]